MYNQHQHHHYHHSHTSNVLDRIRTLQSIVNYSQEAVTTPITTTAVAPSGFTVARWGLALQSFNERFHLRRKREIEFEAAEAAEEEAYMVPFGPEWELQQRMRELDSILKEQQ